MIDEMMNEFAEIFSRLSPEDQDLVIEYVDAMASGDTEKVQRMEREVRARREL